MKIVREFYDEYSDEDDNWFSYICRGNETCNCGCYFNIPVEKEHSVTCIPWALVPSHELTNEDILPCGALVKDCLGAVTSDSAKMKEILQSNIIYEEK